MSETVRWRTPILVAKLSWLKPSSRLRSRMQLPSCKGVRAILSFVMGLGGYPPKAPLGAFPPNTRLGAIPFKEPGRLGASFSHRRRNPQRSKLASRPYFRIVTAPAASYFSLNAINETAAILISARRLPMGLILRVAHLSLLQKTAVSDQLSHNGDNLPDYLCIAISELISPMHSARVGMNDQTVVLQAAAPARIGSVALENDIQRLLPHGFGAAVIWFFASSEESVGKSGR